ncbi:hypothetical protein D9615_003974 [Tricholomella constricta]|uniref:DUF4211 domain-containing protein n=1 Tax=Tricholomella constricta TaxID=117010 RepID=A0A8H5M4I4_9AGAR|nr:hypothetical protein D9615_003974 [Tricholomella constricta]
MPSTRKTSQSLRQTTLSEPLKSSTRASSSRLPSSPVLLKRKRKRNAILPQGTDHDDDAGLGSIKFEPQKSRLSSDDDVVVSAHKKRKASMVLDSDDSLSRVQTRTRLERKGKSRRFDDDDDDDTQQPRRRKLVKKRAIALTSSSDDEDLAEEVEKDRILTSRLRKRDKKTAFQKSLEKLRRRKQGKPSESPSSEDEEETSGSGDRNTPFKGAKPSSDYDSLFDEESDASHSSDFIVEDDNNNVIAALPMQFSMESHQDLDHQFKKIFQFFVHIAARPAKERHHYMKEQLRKEEYFSVPLQMVRRKISGLRDSLVASSVWRPAFKNPLETYPEFDLIPLDFAIPSCDACHLGGRLSTLVGRLSGVPYDRWGFEIKDKERSSSSDSDDSEGEDSDAGSSGSEDQPAVIEFNLGRFCARRTQVYHEFTHWEYALFKCIRDEVDELHASRQSGGFFRIAYVGGMKPPEDLDDADSICEWLDQRKVIDMEWKKLKDMMESARHLELDRKKGDND